MRVFNLLGVILAGLMWAGSLTADPSVRDIRIGAQPDSTRIVVETDSSVPLRWFFLAEPTPRLVLDLPPVDFDVRGNDIGFGQSQMQGRGSVDTARFARFSPQTSRIVFDLTGGVRMANAHVLAPSAGEPHYRYVFDLEPVDYALFAEAIKPQRPDTRAAQNTPQPRSRALSPRDLTKKVVVIDPGHGGRDSGAVSPHRALYEKDVNLAAGLTLKALLEETGRYQVYMTRDQDVFIELEDRVFFARERGADLFISLHADSSGSNDRSVRGASVYTLAQASAVRAEREVLARQDWLIDIPLDQYDPYVSDILVTMSQAATLGNSEKLAQKLIPEMKTVGPILRNTHRRRGFKVLLAPDIPAVLIEMGFLSNAADSANLASPRYREKLMQAVARSVDAYFASQERLYAQD